MQISENGVGYNGSEGTIRRLANPIGWDASVQRFVIPAADVSGAIILSTQPDEVEHVFAWIEHVDFMSERIYLTNSLCN